MKARWALGSSPCCCSLHPQSARGLLAPKPPCIRPRVSALTAMWWVNLAIFVRVLVWFLNADPSAMIAGSFHPYPHANSRLNVLVADGCIATVAPPSICECCLLVNLTFLLASLGADVGLNSDAVAQVQPRGCPRQSLRCHSQTHSSSWSIRSGSN